MACCRSVSTLVGTLAMQALHGLKVLELGQLIAGPFAGKTLADFGADVIKVEPPGVGDPLRKWRLLRDGTVGVVGGAVAQQAFGVPRPAHARRPGTPCARWPPRPTC